MDQKNVSGCMEVREATPMEQRMRGLHNEIGVLRGALDNLRSRMTPVLLRAQPKSDVPPPPCTAAESRSPMYDEVADLTEQITVLSTQVDDMTKRLDV